MSKVVYFSYQATLLETLPAGSSLVDTIVYNGFDTGISAYYEVGGNSFVGDRDYVRLTITQMTFDRPANYGQLGSIQTETSTQTYPLWESRTVADSFTIPQPPLPDLRTALKLTSPSTVAKDGTLTFDMSLFNSGPANAGAFQVAFYLSKDAKIDASDTKWLWWDETGLTHDTSAGFSTDVPLFDYFAAGKYYIGAIIDSDGRVGESNEGNNTSNAIAITITGPNDDPVAGADTVTVNYETPTKIDVLANDSDPNGDKLSFVVQNDEFHKPRHGVATRNSDNTITYTPDEGFVGTDTITYTLSDGKGGEVDGIVSVTVGFEDVVEPMGKLRARSIPYEWDFEIPEGVQGTYTFEFEITKPTTMRAFVTSDGPVKAPVQFHPELIASLGNVAPTLGPGPDRIGRGDKGYMSEEGTSQIFEDPLMPGKYSFEILRQPNDTGPAGGHIQLFLSADEAGNRIEWAANARMGTTNKGVVDRIDNKDVYKFTLKEQSSVAVSLAVAGLTNKDDGVPALHYEILTNAGSTQFYQVLDSHMATSAFIDTAYTAPDLTDVANTPLDAGDYYVIIYHAPVQPFSEDRYDERYYNLWINAWADHAANRPLTTDFGAEGPKSANIGDLTNKTYANRDYLGLADGNDYYMFSLTQKSTVRMALTQSSKDVSMDLEFASMSGGSIAAQLVDAVGDGAGSRTIVATLDAGTYMLRAHTDTDFGNTTASNGYGVPLVLPHKGGSTYDLKITSSTTLTTLENGTSGADNYLGSTGADKFNGKAGNDWLQGKGGNDNLIGDLGIDRIDGGDGDDFIIGGMSPDTLTGGPGSDTFMYLKPTEGGDTIVDFTPGPRPGQDRHREIRLRPFQGVEKRRRSQLRFRAALLRQRRWRRGDREAWSVCLRYKQPQSLLGCERFGGGRRVVACDVEQWRHADRQRYRYQLLICGAKRIETASLHMGALRRASPTVRSARARNSTSHRPGHEPHGRTVGPRPHRSFIASLRRRVRGLVRYDSTVLEPVLTSTSATMPGMIGSVPVPFLSVLSVVRTRIR